MVGVHYDPMLAKVIAHAPDAGRGGARLAAALAGAQLHGVGTNRDLLVRALRHPEFLAGRTDTDFLERHADALLEPLADAEAERLHAVAAALAARAARRAAAPVLGSRRPAGATTRRSCNASNTKDGRGRSWWSTTGATARRRWP